MIQSIEISADLLLPLSLSLVPILLITAIFSFTMAVFKFLTSRRERKKGGPNNPNNPNFNSKITEQQEFINEKRWDQVVEFLGADRSKVKRWEKKELISIICSSREKMESICEDINVDESAKELFLKIIECGGRLAFETTRRTCQRTLLQIAIRYKAPMEVVSKVIAVGGWGIVVDKTAYGWNSLHVACRYHSSVDLVTTLIEVGGRYMLTEKDSKGWNVLHYACRYNAPFEVVTKLIEEGGEDLVTAKAQGGVNALHLISFQNAPIDLMMKLVEVGGADLIRDRVKNNLNALHVACGCNAPINVITKLLEVGGYELLSQKDKLGRIPLHILISEGGYPSQQGELIETVALLIKKGLESQVGGEFGVGGLFDSASKNVQAVIYNKWNSVILPALEQVDQYINVNQEPMLQAAIISKAPSATIVSILDHLDCVNTQDKYGRFPLDVAIEQSREWSNGTKAIAKAFAAAQKCTLLNICAKHGLSWENGLKYVMLEEGGCKEIGDRDSETDMLPFMLAEDTASIFHLIKMNPSLVSRGLLRLGESEMKLEESNLYHNDFPGNWRAEFFD